MKISAVVVQHPRLAAFYRRAVARAMQRAELEPELDAQCEWQAVASHCALRLLEAENATEASSAAMMRVAGSPTRR
jgi:hypothetical protein